MKNNKTLLILAAATLLLITFLSAKNHETKNPVYEYLYITESSGFGFRAGSWNITTHDTIVERITKDKDFRNRYKGTQFITQTINRFEREGYELFSFDYYESDTDESGSSRGHYIVMRKKRLE